MPEIVNNVVKNSVKSRNIIKKKKGKFSKNSATLKSVVKKAI